MRNEYVELQRLGAEHHDDLVTAVSVDDLWRTWVTRIPSPEGMSAEIERRLALHEEGPIA